jgi:hypothetical protein
MKRTLAGGAVAVAFAMVAVAQAQTPQPQPPTSSQPTAQRPADRPMADKEITLVGCIQSEDDYRKAQNLGRGGAAGTGVGGGNEFVLVNASTSTASAGTPSSGAPAGTAGTTGMASGTAYELTGGNESQAAQFVGKRVEIMGKLKAAEMGATGPTGGATAGSPPSGVDVTSKDLKLREIEVTSIKETTGSCPAGAPR